MKSSCFVAEPCHSSYPTLYKVPSKYLHNIYYAFVYPHILYDIELYVNTYYSYLDKLVKLKTDVIHTAGRVYRETRHGTRPR